MEKANKLVEIVSNLSNPTLGTIELQEVEKHFRGENPMLFSLFEDAMNRPLDSTESWMDRVKYIGLIIYGTVSDYREE